MRKTTKKIWSVLLSMAMVAGFTPASMPATAKADNTGTVYQWTGSVSMGKEWSNTKGTKVTTDTGSTLTLTTEKTNNMCIHMDVDISAMKTPTVKLVATEESEGKINNFAVVNGTGGNWGKVYAGINDYGEAKQKGTVVEATQKVIQGTLDPKVSNYFLTFPARTLQKAYIWDASTTSDPDPADAAPVVVTTATPVPTATPVLDYSYDVSKGTSDTVPDTAIDVAKDMGAGWNLGNTMESCGNVMDTAEEYETSLGMPKTTKLMIDHLRAQGVKSVRIPVAWSNLMSTDGKFTINKGMFKRVDEIVGYVLSTGMYAIVNIHYDGGWWNLFGGDNISTISTASGFSQDDTTLYQNEWKNYFSNCDSYATTDEACMAKYKAMWTQISSHYKDYSQKLIFESANEELGRYFSMLSASEKYTKTLEVNQAFVDVVRKSGGNNANRFLLIAGNATDINLTVDDAYKMPADTISNHLLISVHYYDPWGYCGGNNKTDTWGSDTELAYMKAQFEKMKKFTEAGYGVIIGEYGVCHYSKDGEYSVKSGTDAFFGNVLKNAKEMGYCAMIWDCNDWYSRTTYQFKDEAIKTAFTPYLDPVSLTTVQTLSATQGTYAKTEVTATPAATAATAVTATPAATVATAVTATPAATAATTAATTATPVVPAATAKVTPTATPAAVKLSKPTVKSIQTNVKKKQVTIKWEKNSKAAGYRLQISLSKTFKASKGTKTYTISKKLSAKTVKYSKLKKHKAFYVRMKTCYKVKGKKKYSTWSKIYKQKVK